MSDSPLGAVYDVRAFGAKGDGVVDDAPAIQAAVDTALAHGGGTVFLPPGVYILGRPNVATPSIYLGSRIILRGAGAGSVIKRNPGGNARPLIHNKGRTKATGGTGAGDEGIVIADLALDGNKGSTKGYA